MASSIVNIIWSALVSTVPSLTVGLSSPNCMVASVVVSVEVGKSVDMVNLLAGFVHVYVISLVNVAHFALILIFMYVGKLFERPGRDADELAIRDIADAVLAVVVIYSNLFGSGVASVVNL